MESLYIEGVEEREEQALGSAVAVYLFKLEHIKGLTRSEQSEQRYSTYAYDLYYLNNQALTLLL